MNINNVYTVEEVVHAMFEGCDAHRVPAQPVVTVRAKAMLGDGAFAMLEIRARQDQRPVYEDLATCFPGDALTVEVRRDLAR